METAKFREGIFFRAAIAMGIFIGLASRADAGTIVQTVGFNFATHNTTYGIYQQFDYGIYQQFDPSLGSLTEVDVTVSGGASVGNIATFINTSFSQTISFTGFTSFTVSTDAGFRGIMSLFTDVLPPGSERFEDAGGSFDLSTSYRDNLSSWIGTGQLTPFEFAAGAGPLLLGFQAESDNPNINIIINSNFPAEPAIRGTETITYIFSAVPEPSSLVMSGTAAFVLALVCATK
jgi:hypothetical protein